MDPYPPVDRVPRDGHQPEVVLHLQFVDREARTHADEERGPVDPRQLAVHRDDVGVRAEGVADFAEEAAVRVVETEGKRLRARALADPDSAGRRDGVREAGQVRRIAAALKLPHPRQEFGPFRHQFHRSFAGEGLVARQADRADGCPVVGELDSVERGLDGYDSLGFVRAELVPRAWCREIRRLVRQHHGRLIRLVDLALRRRGAAHFLSGHRVPGNGREEQAGDDEDADHQQQRQREAGLRLHPLPPPLVRPPRAPAPRGSPPSGAPGTRSMP